MSSKAERLAAKTAVAVSKLPKGNYGSFVANAAFWVPVDATTHTIEDVALVLAKDGKTVRWELVEGVMIGYGANYAAMQEMDLEESYDIKVRQMQPNPNITQADVDAIVESARGTAMFDNMTKGAVNWAKCLKGDAQGTILRLDYVGEA
jgi:hypothetical protein